MDASALRQFIAKGPNSLLFGGTITGMGFQTGDQQEVDHAEGFVRFVNRHGSASRGMQTEGHREDERRIECEPKEVSGRVPAERCAET